MTTQPTSAAGRGPGSFPLSEELDFETWDLTLLTSEEIPAEAISTSPKATPGHYWATLLLDGISCSGSGSGSSTRSTPAGSFDGTSAQQPPPAATGPTAAAGGSEQAAVDHLEAAGPQSHPSTAAAGQILQVLASPSTSSYVTEPSSISTPMQLQLPAEASGSRNAAGHVAAPSALQLPDFSAFMLPEECAFAESSMDDALTTPTPHTPVVPNMFAGQGLPVSVDTLCLHLVALVNPIWWCGLWPEAYTRRGFLLHVLPSLCKAQYHMQCILLDPALRLLLSCARPRPCFRSCQHAPAAHTTAATAATPAAPAAAPAAAAACLAAATAALAQLLMTAAAACSSWGHAGCC